MTETAKIVVGGKEYTYPVIRGTENDKGIDMGSFRKDSSYISLDPGYGNTGACESAITYIDGEKGILRYRGYPIEQLAEQSTFVEVAYLLIHGELPAADELKSFSQDLSQHSMIHEDMKNFFLGFPNTGHPMAILSAMVNVLSAYYPELLKPDPSHDDINIIARELLAKVRTMAAFSYKKTIGEPFVYPKTNLPYVPNFLNMMFTTPTQDYQIDDIEVKALRTFLILHADHEQNCSASTVRLVGSSHANLFASVSAGISALWGPLHGGANQKVVEMLEQIHSNGGHYQKHIDLAKDKKSGVRLMGFGHRVYKNFDPRAKIIKNLAHQLLKKKGVKDPLLDIAINLEEIVLKDDYFIERKLYPNVDFYSGLILRAIGIPTDMFPVMFAIGRLPGWIAHWIEQVKDPNSKIGRPRQIYVGSKKREFVPIEKRS
ncbi:citrate synthase [PVC group bacterium]|nr:citrate synthase [PVC group bacterium]